MNQESEEIKEYKAPDLSREIDRAVMKKIENGDFLSHNSFLDSLNNLGRIIFETEDLHERAEFYTAVMNNARAVDYAEAAETAFKEEASKRGMPELWELPKEFEKPVKTQKFDPNYLPGFLKDYIKAVADNVQVDVEMCILPLLSTLADCVHGKFRVCFPKSNHKEPLNLYTVTVAPPGDRKSGAYKVLPAPLFEYQKQENQRRKPLIAEYKAKYKSLTNELERFTRGKNADEIKAQQVALELENLKPVNRMTLNITDCTPESLTAELADNNETMGILDEECGIFNNIAGLYSNGVANLDIFLKSYDGSPYVVTRRTKENIYLDRPVITIGLMAQPDAFEAAMNKPEFIGRGFIQRFLFAFPDSRQGGRSLCSPPIPNELQEQYRKLIFHLLDMKTPSEDEEPQTLSFDKNASNLLDNYFHSIEDRLKEGGSLVYMAEWANKLFAKCCRIAGILHLCTHEPTELIDEDTARRATCIAMWAENQAHKAFGGTAFEDKTTKDAKYLLGKLRENKQAIWAKNDILQKCRALNAAKIGEALELLDEMKCIRLIEERTKTKTKLTIRVNPLITGK